MRKFIAIAVALTTALVVFTSCADTETDAEHIHTWYDATCTKPRTCSVCGITDGEALGHTVEEWTVTVEATCTTSGEQTGVCTVCGETVTETIEKGEHEYGEWTVTEEATCTTIGKQTATCIYCGDTIEESIKQTGHTYGEWITTVEPTCTSEGEKTRVCTVCGYEAVTTISKTSHDYGEWVITTEATCQTNGVQSKTCSVCGYVTEQITTKAEHTPGEWVVTREATALLDGERTQYCSVCGEAITTERFSLSDEEIAQTFKDSCEEYTYDQIARNPDDYYLTKAKYTGEVIQVLEDDDYVGLRVNITKGTYTYTDTIYVILEKGDNYSRLLEDDIVEVYGYNMGLTSYTSVIGTTVTLPLVYAEYVDLVG